MMKELSTLKTEEQYEEALSRIEALMDLDNPTQAQYKEQEVLGRLVEAYEDEHYPISLPDLEEARRFRAKQDGKTWSEEDGRANALRGLKRFRC